MVTFRRTNLGHTWLDIKAWAGVSIRAYQSYGFRIGEFRRTGPGPLSYASVSYVNYPRERYYGIGPGTRKADRVSFLYEQWEGHLWSGYRFSRRWALRGTLGYLSVRLGKGRDSRFPEIRERFDESSAPGLATGPDFFHGRAEMEYDGRDYPGEPHRGFYLAGAWDRFVDRDPNRDYSFHRLTLDARAYVPLFSPARTLALRFLGGADFPDAGAEVPFFLMQTLGGSHILRGFRSRRFRDRAFLFMAAEYRWEWFKYGNFLLFYEAGKVLHDRAGFNLRGLEASYGAGFQLKNHHVGYLRIEYAVSREDRRVNVLFGPTF